MASKDRKLSLTSYDDIFKDDTSRADEQKERVIELSLEELHPFRNHPFHVRDDEAMARTVESVKEYGVLTPGIARPLADGGYEVVSGHRRKRACELAGLTTMPFIVREMDDQLMQRLFKGMAERRVPKIVHQSDSLGKIIV